MNNKHFSNDEDAQVGIGTMIVFIATILVAAVAAGVLIDTSQKLQAKSVATGNDATEQVGNALDFQTIYGKRDTTSGSLLRLEMWVTLAAGSEPLDLSELIVQYKTDSATTTFEWEDDDLSAFAGTTGHQEFVIYDSTGAVVSGTQVISPGDRLMLLIGSTTAGGTSLGLAEAKSVQVDLIPEVGASLSAEMRTPETYQSNLVFELF